MATIVLPPAQPVQTRDELLRAEFDVRSGWKKVADTIISLWKLLTFLLETLFDRLFGEEVQPILPNPQHSESRGLVVLIHGLRSSPKIWSTQLSLLNQHPVDIFAPVVPERGMCPLESAATPIYPVILEYAQKNPQKPIAILGVSNGSRIATWLETRLREDAPQNAVRVSTIAGVHFGSSRMNQLDSCGLATWFYPAALIDELKYGSLTARALLDRVIAPLPPGCGSREYEFYATTEDLSVPDLGSSLPLLNKGERYRVLHGHSHDSIVAAVAEEQIGACLNWMI